MFSSWFDAFMESAVELAMRRPELIQLFVIRRRPKLNQLEHNNLADDEDQLQALKSKSQESAGSLHSRRKGSDVVEDPVASYRCNNHSHDVITISRWSEVQKLKRRRVEIQQMD
ncbi:hypothetical protein F511_17671 [Dorcoceras hygrometricum]|uniref:Uncharacterized protein n=1 Tax=Dorcoceras hygrometricum TaxID=472368 RepID=A0A2Z7AZL4_9LAMI|nr:hypothetical protein F511_17671 [Dorcoceras hygrometricum]